MKLGVMASEEARPQGLKPRFGWRAHVAPEGATPARPKRRERRGQGPPWFGFAHHKSQESGYRRREIPPRCARSARLSDGQG